MVVVLETHQPYLRLVLALLRYRLVCFQLPHFEPCDAVGSCAPLPLPNGTHLESVYCRSGRVLIPRSKPGGLLQLHASVPRVPSPSLISSKIQNPGNLGLQASMARYTFCWRGSRSVIPSADENPSNTPKLQ